MQTNIKHPAPQSLSNIDINLEGLETITADTVNIVGLVESFQLLITKMEAFEKAIKHLHIEIKEVQAHVTIPPFEPNITVKAPEVRVTVPDIKLPEIKAPDVTVMPERVARVTKVVPKYKDGELDSITEFYEDGTKRTLKGLTKASWEFSYD